jgi:hypothetical protein
MTEVSEPEGNEEEVQEGAEDAEESGTGDSGDETEAAPEPEAE